MPETDPDDDRPEPAPGRRGLPPAGRALAVLAVPVLAILALLAVRAGGDGRPARSTAPATTESTTGDTAPTETTAVTVEETTTVPPEPEPETTTTLAPPDPNVRALQALVVGDCFNTPPEGVTEVRLIDCDQPHTDEVYEVIVLKQPRGARYPRNIDDQAEERCYESFITYVGAPPEDTPYDYDWYTPTEAEWNAGARRIPCVVTDPDGKPVTGSAGG